MSTANQLVEVRTRHRAYLRDYFWKISFDREALRLSSDSWAWKLVLELALDSQAERVSNSTARAIRTILRWIETKPQLHKFSLLEPRQVVLSELREFLNMSESLAATELNRRHLCDLSTFRMLLFSLGRRVFVEDFSRRRVGFKAKVRYVATPRPLLSDGMDALSLSTGHPLGAIPFEKFSDLKERHKRKVSADLERIRDACIVELNLGAAARERLLDLASKEPEKRVLEMLGNLSPEAKSLRKTLYRAGVLPQEVLHAIAFEISRRQLYKSNAPPYQVSLLRDVLKVLFAPAPPFASRRALEMGYRASSEEVFAATLLLQTYCGWNFSSLMTLPADGLRFTGTLVEISGGFKSKTGDDAPPFALERSSPGVSQAVELLLWNREQLILHGYLSAHRKDIFVCGPRSHYDGLHPASRLDNFIKRQQLPAFSLDQVRTQVLYQVSLKSGVEDARRVAGHSHVATTGNYLHQLAAQRLHSASNLEFQKRLEGELLYALKPSERRRTLLGLTRIGDGSSCIDPTDPPAGRSDNPSGCLGLQCHTSGGCPHRRIVIDLDRMEDTLRMKAHYEARHHIMRDANPDHFEKIVLPAIMFNEALHQVLERGPHSGTYAKIARRLGKSDVSAS